MWASTHRLLDACLKMFWTEWRPTSEFNMGGENSWSWTWVVKTLEFTVGGGHWSGRTYHNTSGTELCKVITD
jgi:hypothetical protein